MRERFEREWAAEDTDVPALRGGERIGYIVATCSPVTRAHLELAAQAVAVLSLDRLFFVIWPFHYIPGFHAEPLDAWVAEQRHLPWEDRVDLIARSATDPRIQVLDQSADWYRESEANYDEAEPRSAFWTGTWYVLRKLQWHLRTFGGAREFYFVCGTDQLKDCSIAQQLTLHHVYCVGRGASAESGPRAEFTAPYGSSHQVIIGSGLVNAGISATQIRSGALGESRLDDVVSAAVADRIRERGWWGYRPE